MKKLLLCLLFSGMAFAQDSEGDTEGPVASRKNEIRIDALSLIAFGKANISYERFGSSKWSYGVTGSFAFGDKFEDDFDEGYRSTLPKYEVVPYIRYKMSNSDAHYYFVEGFISANGGDFREIVRVDDGATGFYKISKEEYFSVAPGASLGYKVYFAQRVALEFLVGAGFNLLDGDKSPDVISRIGLNLGYRF
ncbi:DUF3575 domain-containing protein [Flavobacterium selenitireducens]|uniref:DUF3575 domain-containing protein n=1 Tax=Flavobacterium selenitireducens TaxID=2722704 RepID=UPI00168A6C99|nr:DUF3575 domain-containing protein [Flavobacterium selenitireducens]MBD3580977.1 DUF3575 domain-containing protein [Flavobacterium selenitireducens]